MRLERTTRRTNRLIAGIAGLTVGLAATFSAQAADKYVLEEVDETSVEFGTGWYIRGDIGVSKGATHRDAGITAFGARADDDVSTAFAFRVGAGVRVSPNLRLDTTFDYHSRSERSIEGQIFGGCQGERETASFDPALGIIVTTTTTTTIVDCTTRDVDEYDSQDMMLNAYYDLAPKFGLTPYVGVSLGATRMNYSARRGDIVCNPLTDERCNDVRYALAGEYGEQATSNQNINEGTSYHLAGGLTLGVGYQLSKNLMLDASYQLTKTMEDPLWGGSNGYDVVDADSLRHNVRVGLRYELW